MISLLNHCRVVTEFDVVKCYIPTAKKFFTLHSRSIYSLTLNFGISVDAIVYKLIKHRGRFFLFDSKSANAESNKKNRPRMPSNAPYIRLSRSS